jgi:amino acid transporter
VMPNFWGWLFGTSDTADSGGSTVFSYVLVGAVVLLLVAVIFGELEAA